MSIDIPCSWCGMNAAMPDSNECESCAKSMHNRSGDDLELRRLQAENERLVKFVHVVIDRAKVVDDRFPAPTESILDDLRKQAAALLASLPDSEE
jgi:archaellum component FlaC